MAALRCSALWDVLRGTLRLDRQRSPTALTRFRFRSSGRRESSRRSASSYSCVSCSPILVSRRWPIRLFVGSRVGPDGQPTSQTSWPCHISRPRRTHRRPYPKGGTREGPPALGAATTRLGSPRRRPPIGPTHSAPRAAPRFWSALDHPNAIDSARESHGSAVAKTWPNHGRGFGQARRLGGDGHRSFTCPSRATASAGTGRLRLNWASRRGRCANATKCPAASWQLRPLSLLAFPELCRAPVSD